MDLIGRHMKGFFDYGIADEVHELKGETAQGAALGTIASCAKRTIILTGTLNGGYADELFNILFRLHPKKMLEEGFAHGEAGVRAFSETYGVLEKVTTISPADNACSDKAKVTTRVRRRPGASPLLFGRFLMELGAFVSLEDISDALPPYEEEVITVEMDPVLAAAYKSLEEDIKAALEEHRGNQSVVSIGLNALMLYPDRPFGTWNTLRPRGESRNRRARTVCDLGSSGPGSGVRLCEGTPAGGRGQDRASPGKKGADLRCLHAEARRHPAAEEHLEPRGHSRRSSHHRCTARSSGSLV